QSVGKLRTRRGDPGPGARLRPRTSVPGRSGFRAGDHPRGVAPPARPSALDRTARRRPALAALQAVQRLVGSLPPSPPPPPPPPAGPRPLQLCGAALLWLPYKLYSG